MTANEPTDIERVQPGGRMSQAVVHGGLVYLSGQVALDAVGANVGDQTRRILAQVDALLTAAGTGRARLLSATIWLADIATFAEMNAVWDAWIEGCPAPARATVGAALALPGLAVEIAVIAAMPAGASAATTPMSGDRS